MPMTNVAVMCLCCPNSFVAHRPRSCVVLGVVSCDQQSKPLRAASFLVSLIPRVSRSQGFFPWSEVALCDDPAILSHHHHLIASLILLSAERDVCRVGASNISEIKVFTVASNTITLQTTEKPKHRAPSFLSLLIGGLWSRFCYTYAIWVARSKSGPLCLYKAEEFLRIQSFILNFPC